jgi:agarase
MNDDSHDKYGGWTGLTGKRTGYFHTEQIQGKWWLVTPEGNAFWSKGVCHISYEGDAAPALGYAPYNRAVAAKYGSASGWAKATADRMRGWGLNTVGAWSSPEMNSVGLAYTSIADLAAAANPNLWLHGGFPDVFSAEWRKEVDQAAAKRCGPHKNDPWLLGYFSDNELRWGPDWRSKDSLLETFLKMPEGTPGRKRAEGVMTSHRRTLDVPVSDEAKADFQEMVAAEYFKVCHDAIRRHDPHHMILGCRFAGYAPDPVVRGMSQWVDLVSYNNYSHQAPIQMLEHLTSITAKPVMVTEFSFKAMDSGLPNAKGGGSPVATQQDRADLFDHYITAISKLPNCVGYHWFEYADEPKEGRFDGENCNYGLVKIDDSAWDLLTDRVREVNARLEIGR